MWKEHIIEVLYKSLAIKVLKWPKSAVWVDLKQYVMSSI